MTIRHVVSIKHLNVQDIMDIYERARLMEANPKKYADLLRGRILSTLFFEPSTRTRLSFESAMLRLGGNVLGFSTGAVSSAKKGESIADTIRMAMSYSDVIVLRHYIEGAGIVASEYSNVPVISGGTGSQEHPTQALLDGYTIMKQFSRLSDLTLALIGDLRYGRTIPSLLYLLSKFKGNKVYLVSPPQLRAREEVLREVKGKLDIIEVNSFEDVMPELDVAYVTRVQKERFIEEEEYEKVKGSYVITLDTLKDVKPDFILLHPLPRVGEIAYEVDASPHAKYFEQAKNGVWTRMGILTWVLNTPVSD